MRESTGFFLVVVGLFLVGFPTLCAFGASGLIGGGGLIISLPFILLGAWVLKAGLAAFPKKKPSSRITQTGPSNAGSGLKHSTNPAPSDEE